MAEHTLQGPHWHRTDEFAPMRLVLQPGGQAIELLRADVLIGRHTDADVRLPLPDVSRRHCRCVYSDGMWHITDLDSLNGIYINGVRVQQADLHQGDQVLIGGFTFEVDLNGEVQAKEVLQRIADALPERRAS